MLTIDGSLGEGGGQVLRTALSLSALTGTAVRVERIRAGRPEPGLKRQHLVAVEAAAAVCDAEVEGAGLGLCEVTFRPRALRPRELALSIGSAGSTTLVLQTVLPPLLAAGGPSTVSVEGGTHNPLAPPFEFLERAFLPLVARLGPRVEARLERAGFYPAGGGRVVLRVEPAPLGRLDLLVRGEVRRRRAQAFVANLPRTIALRELGVVADRLGWGGGEGAPAEASLEPVVLRDVPGHGNALVVEVGCEHATEVFTGLGERRVRAETVAERVCAEVVRWFEADVPVGEHLADQLLVPLAMSGGGSFRTLPLTPHATTNMAVIERFLPVRFVTRDGPDGSVTVEVTGR